MSDQGSLERPPRPRLTLRVGVTGKRELAVTDTIRGEIGKVLDLLAHALRDSFEKNNRVLAPDRPVMRVVCGLAEGADQVVARVAINRASETASVDVRLAAILPFPREEFIKDFELDPNRNNQRRTPEELAPVLKEFRELLAAAEKDAVLELDDEALRATGQRAHRDLAYVGLRDLLVQHSDIIIAILDEAQEGKPGGSADVARLAGQERVPVIRISTAGKPVSLLRAAEPDDPDQRPAADGDAVKLDDREALTQLVAAILSPPRPGSQPNPHAAHGPRSGRQRLDDFLDEAGKPASFAWVFKKSRAVLLRWLGVAETPEPPPEDPVPAPYTSELRFREILMRRFASADAQAIRYADNTRSSYIAIGTYGALAVLLGLMAVLFMGKMAGLAKTILLGAEGFLLWRLAVQFYRPAHGGSWHERMVEYRVLAELLRHQRFIYAFGAASRAERAGDRSWRGPDAWLGWYVQATTRELGFPTARLCATYRRAALEVFRSRGIAAQIRYNERERNRNTAIDDALGRFIERAWAAATYTALFGAAVVLVLWIAEVWSPFHHEAEFWLDHVVKPVLTIFLAFVPALIAAVHGIRFQMEFASAAKRAEATVKELSAVDEKLDKLLQSGDPGRKSSEAIVRDANDAMVADLSGWSTVYKHKAAELV